MRLAEVGSQRVRLVGAAVAFFACCAPACRSTPYEVLQLHQAAASGDVAGVTAALSRGVDPDSRDADGWTPLMLAAYGGYVGVLRTLVSAGADIDARKGFVFLGHGETALIWAAREGRVEAVAQLLSSGADFKAASYCGTPLDYAVARGHSEIVALLEARGSVRTSTPASCRALLGRGELPPSKRNGHGR